MASGILAALLRYSGESHEAIKLRKNRLIETLAETFPQVEFFRIATSDPVVRKMLDDLTPDQFSEVVGPYMADLLPTLSVEEISGFVARTFQGLEPDQLRRLLPAAARGVRTSLVFVRLLPLLSTPPARGKPVACQIGTASLTLDPAAFQVYRDNILQVAGLSSAEAQALGPDELTIRLGMALVKGFGSPPWQQVLEHSLKLVGKEGLRGITAESEAYLTQLFQANSSGLPAPISPTVEPPKPQKHEPPMAQAENIVVAKDGALFKGGHRYLPLAIAAPQAQAHRTTLLRWIKDNTKVQGRPLETFYFAPLDTYFISEDSVQRAANRFVKWPSEKPAGRVTLGETDDESGYLGMSEAAAVAGIAKRTMWLWASQGKAPTEKPLDVIKDTASDFFYIREKDAHDLKRLVPRSGLHRGRRPQLTP